MILFYEEYELNMYRKADPTTYVDNGWAHMISYAFCFSTYYLIVLLRLVGIEPTHSAWKANILPLNYNRV